jgi:hypothetical protein
MNKQIYQNECLIGSFIASPYILDEDLISLTDFFSRKENGFAPQTQMQYCILLTMNPYELKSTFDMKVALLFKTKGSYL